QLYAEGVVLAVDPGTISTGRVGRDVAINAGIAVVGAIAQARRHYPETGSLHGGQGLYRPCARRAASPCPGAGPSPGRRSDRPGSRAAADIGRANSRRAGDTRRGRTETRPRLPAGAQSTVEQPRYGQGPLDDLHQGEQL